MDIFKYLTHNSRQSLAAEGIHYTDEQWERIVRAARNGQGRYVNSEITDPEEISKSLTKAYKNLGPDKG